MKTLTEQQIKEIRKNPNNQNWYIISCDYKLSEPFIREFKDYVNWYHISQYQKLSEDFIREFKDEIYWWWISKCQKLSETFIFEFFDKLNIELILKHQNHLSIETKNKIKLIQKLKNK